MEQCWPGAWGGRGCLPVSGGAAHAKPTRACPGPLTVCLPRSVGLFPEDDIPEKAYRKLLEGRRERKAKKRLPKSRLQSKTGRTPARGRGGGFRSGCHGEHACTVSPKLACTRAPYFLPECWPRACLTTRGHSLSSSLLPAVSVWVAASDPFPPLVCAHLVGFDPSARRPRRPPTQFTSLCSP